jgi:cystathionine beta-lyase
LEVEPSTHFIEKGKVAFQPGIRFGEQWAHYLRFNFATSPEIIEEAINRAAQSLK